MEEQNRYLPGKGMKICLEVIVAALSSQSTLCYSVTRHDVSGITDDPVHLVQEFLKNAEYKHLSIPPDQCIIHSTSWRYEADRTVVLTYVVYTDSAVFHDGSCKVLNLHEAHSPADSTPARPRPANIAESHVVSHGIRHISHLVQRDTKMHKVLSSASIQAFQIMESALAGRIC